MRLLFVSNLFPDQREPYRGLDNATVLHALREEFRAEIRVLALRPMLPWRRGTWQPRPQDVVFQPQYVPARYLPKVGHRWNHRLYRASLRPVMESLKREWPFEAVLASWLFPDACAVAPLISSERFVAIAQGSDVHQYLRIPARRNVITTELRRASSIITRSGELARLLEDAGLQAEQLHTIYNGVDAGQFQPATPEQRAAARAALGLPGTGRVILFVGNFLPVKNPTLLLKAFARLRKEPDLQDTRLVLVGGGPLESELRVQATSGVVFAGRKDAAGVAQAMQAADVLALASHNEGVPNVVLEAFCVGLPVVSTNVGGISEVLPAEYGHLTPPGDECALAAALAQTLRNPPEPSAIVAHGRSFDWKKTAAEYYKCLINITERFPLRKYC